MMAVGVVRAVIVFEGRRGRIRKSTETQSTAHTDSQILVWSSSCKVYHCKHARTHGRTRSMDLLSPP